MNDLSNPLNYTIEGTGITLEPRLQEYLKKKETYKKYQIKPTVPLDTEFGITSEDKKKLKMFKRNDREMYNDNNLGNNQVCNQNISLASMNVNSMLDEQFGGGFLTETIKDKKFDKMFKKHKNIKKQEEVKKNSILRNQQANQTNDYGSNGWLEGEDDIVDGRYFSSDYRRNENNQSVSQQDPTRRQYAEQKYNNPYELNQKKHIKPKISYNQQLHYKDSLDELAQNYSSDVNQIIGDYKSYGQQISHQYQQSSDFDHKHKINIPTVTTRGKRDINSSCYKPMPYMGYGDKIRNVENETEIQRGMPVRTPKSYGYTNSFENQFQYISDDIQSSDHTVLPFPRGGYGTRQYNRENVKPHERDIY